MTDYTDPESPAADPHKKERLEYTRQYSTAYANCVNCGLVMSQHIHNTYCPEWRLRQLDGDR